MLFSSSIYDSEKKGYFRSKLKGHPNFHLQMELQEAGAAVQVNVYDEKSLEKHQKVRIPFSNPILKFSPVVNNTGRRLSADH